jgi:hypothetical protein
MGGGMRGGGMGGRGGRGGPGGGRLSSPIDEIRDNLEANDPLKFLLDRRKPLSLTKPQRDSLERYRSDMQDAQKPVYKEMESLLTDRPRGERGGPPGGGSPGGGSPGGGSPGGGSPGGGPPGGGRGGRGVGGEPSDSTGDVRGRGPSGGPFRAYADKLMDIQDAFRDRARAQLSAAQRTTADSLEQTWLAELRKKEDARRERRRN